MPCMYFLFCNLILIFFSCSGEADHDRDFEPCQGQKDDKDKPPQATARAPQDESPQDAPPLSPQVGDGFK